MPELWQLAARWLNTVGVLQSDDPSLQPDGRVYELAMALQVNSAILPFFSNYISHFGTYMLAMLKTMHYSSRIFAKNLCFDSRYQIWITVTGGKKRLNDRVTPFLGEVIFEILFCMTDIDVLNQLFCNPSFL